MMKTYENVIACYSYTAFTGLEILAIENGFDDFIIYRYCDSTENTYKPHKSKIRYNVKGEPYFINYLDNRRIYLNDCYRIAY